MLTALTGAWTNSPTSYAYQWLSHCTLSGELCSEIPGATDMYYTLSEDDVGWRVRVVVTATNAEGSTSATSYPTEIVLPLRPENVIQPAIPSDPKAGDTVDVDPGVWDNSPIGFDYRWQLCDQFQSGCSTILGADNYPYWGSSYVIRPTDVGRHLLVTVTAFNAAGSVTADTNLSHAIVAAG
jgi:hypothetical protein